MKKILSVLLVLAMMLVMVMGSAFAEGVQRDTLVVVSGDDPTSMAPWAGSNSGVVGLIYMVYESLFIMEHGEAMEPCLAKEYTQDGNTVTVTLFDGIYDSQGNPFTANDAVFSLEQCVAGGNVSYTRILDSFEATDDTTLVLHLKDNLTVGDLETLFTNVYFVTQAAYEASEDQMFAHPVGTGRYAVTNFSPDASITFELRDDYWQKDEQYIASRSHANVKTIRYDYVADSSQRAIAVESGAADVGMSIAFTDTEFVNASQNAVIYPYQMSLTRILLANCAEESPLSDLRVRQAVYYALSNEGLAATYTEGTANPVYDMSNSNFPDYYEDYYKQLAAEGSIYAYDPDKATALLEEAGYKPGELTLTLITDPSTAHTDLATAIQAYLGMVGINMNIETYQNNLINTFAEDRTGWDLFLRQTASNNYATVAWSRPLSAANYSTGGTVNFIFDDKLQEILTLVTTDEGHTEQNVKDGYQYIIDNAYGYGIFVTETYMAVPKTMTKVSMNASLMCSFSSCEFAE